MHAAPHAAPRMHASHRMPHATRRMPHTARRTPTVHGVRWWHIWHSFVSVLGPVFSTARQGLRILHSCFLVLWHVETPSLFCPPVARAYFERHSLRPTPLTLAPRTHTFHIPPPPLHNELKSKNRIGMCVCMERESVEWVEGMPLDVCPGHRRTEQRFLPRNNTMYIV